MAQFLRFVFVVSLAGVATGLSAADPIGWMPGDINAVARVNVADIYQTPLAKKENWKKQVTESFVQQDTVLPPGTQQILIGAMLDLSDRMVAQQKYAVLVPDSQLTLEKLSDWLPGGLEKISGKQAAQFGDDGVVVDTGDGCWLAGYGSRQAITRWLNRGSQAGVSHLSPYLQSALKAKVNTSPVMLAVDLQDNFSKDKVYSQLKETDWFPSESSAESVAEVLASAYGITINVAFDKDRVGHVALDFTKDANVIKPVLEKLVPAVLERLGASSDEFVDWKWTIMGSRVIGTGPISPGGVRRMLSVLDPPSITHAISSATSAATDENRIAKTSQKYYKSLQILLDDLKSTLTKTKDNHALYFERYGRKIDDLPRLHVDGELLEYSARVSSSLRYQGQVQRMTKIQAGTRTEQSGANYSRSNAYAGPYGSYGWVDSATNAQTVNTIRAEGNQAAKEVRFAEWKQIEDGLAALRTKMTSKYQVEF